MQGNLIRLFTLADQRITVNARQREVSARRCGEVNKSVSKLVAE